MSVLPTATLAVRFTNCKQQAVHKIYPTSIESLDPITDRLLPEADEPGVIMIDGPCIICYDSLCLGFDTPESVWQIVRKMLVDNQQHDGEARVEDPMRRIATAVARILLNKKGNGPSLEGFTSDFVKAFGEEDGVRRARQWWLDLVISLGRL